MLVLLPCLAQRARWAAAMRSRAAADMVRRREHASPDFWEYCGIAGILRSSSSVLTGQREWYLFALSQNASAGDRFQTYLRKPRNRGETLAHCFSPIACFGFPLSFGFVPQNPLCCYHSSHMASEGFAYRVLVVDDDPAILQVSSFVFKAQGYEVRTATDGFHVLVELRHSKPDVIVSDLTMPNMSGFELLSVVRRRFPHIPVIAISGEFHGQSPSGLIADAFFSKGQYAPEELFEKIAELIEQSPLRPNVAKPDRAPVWIPRSSTGYFVVTCTDCLRSFSVPDDQPQDSYDVRSTACTFCGTTVQYLANLRPVGKKLKTA